MHFIKYIIKKIGVFYVNKILISREQILKNNKFNVKILRKKTVVKLYESSFINSKSQYSNENDRIKVSPFYLFRFYDVSLIGPYGIPITRNGRIITEKTQQTTHKYILRTISYMGIMKFVKNYLSVFLPFKRYNVKSGFHLVPRHGYSADNPNYCHWLLEDLPQLFGYKTLEKNVLIITNKTQKRFQKESFELLGISNDNIYCHDNNITRVKSLFFSNMRTAQSIKSERDPTGRRWVSNQLKNNLIKVKSNELKSGVFISRQDLNHKYFENMTEIEKVLKKYNIEIYYAGKKSLEDDIKKFERINMIIAPRGAGLSNMIFTLEGCHIIEIGCYTIWQKDFFYLLAKDFNYTFDAVKANLGEKSKPNAESWFLNPRLLEEAILRSPRFNKKK